jgi:hypothetical protein
MNDFIIQFYESKETIKYNEEEILKEVNIDEEDFKMNKISKSDREIFLKVVAQGDNFNRRHLNANYFEQKWNEKFGKKPEPKIIGAFFQFQVDSADYIYGNNVMKMIDFSKENTDIQIDKFIENFIRNGGQHF